MAFQGYIKIMRK